MESNKIIGIDLGTTNSCVAIVEGGQPTIIENSEGSRTTPSVVSFTEDGQRLVGTVAKRQAITKPHRTIISVKRQMGTNNRVKVDQLSFSPEQISAMILQKIKTDAEEHFGEKLSKAVITVPAYFNDAQRQATKDAGQIAGLEVMRIINEPTASALAYGYNRLQDKETLLVFDLGGGTFDVSILEVNDGVFEVKSTSGNNHLGGDDFDQKIVNWMKMEFASASGIDLSSDLMAMSRLREAAEKAKMEVSTVLSSEINLPFIAANESGPKHLTLTLTRSLFDELTAPLVEATVGPLQAALSDAKLTAEQIDHVLLVGGSTRIPAVQEVIKRQLGKAPEKSVNPDEAVALGAAIQGSILAGETHDILLLDVIPLSLGIETAGELFTRVIDRNTAIPTSRMMSFTTTEEGQNSVEVHVLQGERELAKYNQSLAKFSLDGIPRAPRGVPRIDVNFAVDADGILQVSAQDAASGIKQTITVKRSSNLSPEEVDRLEQDAARFAEQDQEYKERVGTRIKAESLIAEAERTIEKYGKSLESEFVEKVRETVENLRIALKAEGETTTIQSLVGGLDVSLLELGRAIYTTSRMASSVPSESESDSASTASNESKE
jgi:molecular chaperone DnaK